MKYRFGSYRFERYSKKIIDSFQRFFHRLLDFASIFKFHSVQICLCNVAFHSLILSFACVHTHTQIYIYICMCMRVWVKPEVSITIETCFSESLSPS